MQRQQRAAPGRVAHAEEGHGRAELQLASIGTGLATIGIGPATGLVVAGEYRRSLGGALARPFLVGSGVLAIGLGAFIVGWGCFETNDCTDAKVGGGIVAGAGALVAAGGLAWAAYDIWDTPRSVRGRSARRVALAPLVGTDRIGLAFTLSE
jgi:hypothetical protein